MHTHTHTHTHTWFVQVNGIKTGHTKLKSQFIPCPAGSEYDREAVCRTNDIIPALTCHTYINQCTMIIFSLRVLNESSDIHMHSRKRTIHIRYLIYLISNLPNHTCTCTSPPTTCVTHSREWSPASFYRADKPSLKMKMYKQKKNTSRESWKAMDSLKLLYTGTSASKP